MTFTPVRVYRVEAGDIPEPRRSDNPLVNLESPYMFVAAMDVDPAHERLFNEVYDEEHVPSLLTVSGVRAVTRFRTLPFELSIGGALKEVPQAAPRYHALYAIDSPDVLVSPAWSDAVERGRWPLQVRPFTTDRRHMLLERLP